MERRDVLKSASAVAAVSTAGMAGCSGILGGGCSKPKDDMTESLPDSDDYEQEGEVFEGDGENQEDVESTVAAGYVGPDDERYSFSIIEFSSKDAAKDQAEEASSGGNDSGDSDRAGGYIIVGKYAYAASAPDEESLKSFMKASPSLSDGCVNNNLETN